MTARRVALTLAAALAVSAGSSLRAQGVGAAPGDDPAWTRRWSPLDWTADLPRTPPSAAPTLPEALLWPNQRVGLFWSGGNPAALPFELTDGYTAFRATSVREDGDYRRPLDPSRTVNTAFSAVSGRPFGGNGAAMGRMRVGRHGLEGELSDFDLPYAGSPYVVMDTAGSELGRTEASLEGAAGWRAGAVGFGVALGYRAQQARTRAAPVPRVLSAADPGASVGVAWRASRRLRLGVHGRWRAHAERVALYSVAGSSRVYWLQGYFEARPQDVVSTYYQRRLERDGLALSLSAAGEAAGAQWAAFVERGKQEERQHPFGSNEPQSDTWTSDAWTIGAAVRCAIPPARADVVGSARYTALTGEARRGDLPDTVTFVGDESVLDAAADLQVVPTPAVRILARVTLRRESRLRRDQLARLRSDIEAWTTGLGIAAEYRPSGMLAVAGGAAVGVYGAAGAIPDPGDRGPAYRRYVAPELSFAASDARGWAASVSALWSALPSGALWARVRRASLTGPVGAVRLPLVPSGTRVVWWVELGVVLGR